MVSVYQAIKIEGKAKSSRAHAGMIQWLARTLHRGKLLRIHEGNSDQHKKSFPNSRLFRTIGSVNLLPLTHRQAGGRPIRGFKDTVSISTNFL